MPAQRIELTAQIKAPVDKVYDWFDNHERFGRIWPGKFRRVVDSSDPANPDGLGSVREIRVGPIPVLMIFREEMTVCDRPSLLEYRVVGAAPIKNHLGQIRFREEQGLTLIDYSIEFDSRIPGMGGKIASDLEKQWQQGIQPVIAELEAQV